MSVSATIYLLTKLSLAASLVFTVIIISQRYLANEPNIKLASPAITSFNEKITIGLITCAGGYSGIFRRTSQIQYIDAAAESSVTLIKSILISAKLAKVKELEFHIFTDSWLVNSGMQTKIKQFEEALEGAVGVTTYFHSVFRVAPLGYEREFIETRKRCAFIRVFFPDYLPNSIKQILYLDTDVIITGNILKIWNNFMDKVVLNVSHGRPPQLAALVPNQELDGMNYFEVFTKNFYGVPHVPPRGVNSGVMFMNLDAMRKSNWSEDIRTIVEARKPTLLGDQQLINVYFHNKLDRLTLFPCQYNFQHLHCERGFACKNVSVDPDGIQIMHGAGGMSKTKGRSHFALYEFFKMFNLTFIQQVQSRLFQPLQNLYNKSYNLNDKEGIATCFGFIGKYLFKTPVAKP